jgi:hypothetical protein
MIYKTSASGKTIGEGRRPELIGGGLIRSLGRWSAVKAMRRSRECEFSDDRILGSGAFVERITKEMMPACSIPIPIAISIPNRDLKSIKHVS